MGGWVDLGVEKYPESAKELLPHSRLEVLDEIVDMVPGALEKLKSIDGEVEKLEYYIELMAIAQKLDNFREGKEDPN